jgi:hypothetical protein
VSTPRTVPLEAQTRNTELTSKKRPRNSRRLA